MLFCDKSGSMAGGPFRTMTEGLEALAGTIFGETVEENCFAEVHTAYYSSELYPHVTTKKDEYLAKVSGEKVEGMTNFVACFEYIQDTLDKYPEGTRFSIIFLTDGNESINKKDVLAASLENLKGMFQIMAETANK